MASPADMTSRSEKQGIASDHQGSALQRRTTRLQLDAARFGVQSPCSLPVEVVWHNEELADLYCGEVRISVRVAGSRGTVAGLVNDLESWILDTLASKVFVQDEAALLLVHPSSGGGVWLCSVTERPSGWQCTAVEQDRPSVSTEYALLQLSDQEQAQHIRDSHSAFISFVGAMSFARFGGQDGLRLLRIKVEPHERWFLRFPLGLFAKLRLSCFETCSACQWIVTNRTITQVAASQRTVEACLADTTAFLSGSYVIINTYKGHESASDNKLVREGFDLVIEILSYFQRLNIRGNLTSLRWTLNPSPELLTSILTASTTRFLFADFEGAGRIWSVGDGPHGCHFRCDHPTDLNGGQIDLTPLRGKLGHIQLMRVFHCNSLYDPYSWNGQPLDASTIGAALLATGAVFVEGSVTPEPPLDFICTMLTTLLGRADLRTILGAKSLTRECDVTKLLGRANPLLTKRGFSPLT